MGQCNIDHSREDVIQKLESQQAFISLGLYETLYNFLKTEHEQDTLNELFHLLKKYDLASEEEQEARNVKLKQLVHE
ncbi:group-specific protein [Pseudobacillus wudalianchiensis]|uniref:Group-specific protein n=1 Tax=Pseudobacillus wudalianchiensis TaxID=1743143 RepID=A0A1B9B7S1_9BACI|nr:group-specific protein [Bacillus wudalianchiensis]OCA92157.1 group-specific protein [Bacillus wudalianchiensis]